MGLLQNIAVLFFVLLWFGYGCKKNVSPALTPVPETIDTMSYIDRISGEWNCSIENSVSGYYFDPSSAYGAPIDTDILKNGTIQINKTNSGMWKLNCMGYNYRMEYVDLGTTFSRNEVKIVGNYLLVYKKYANSTYGAGSTTEFRYYYEADSVYYFHRNFAGNYDEIKAAGKRR